MLHNVKPDALMTQCIAEAEEGSSIYTKQQEDEIRLIFHQSIREGMDFNRIYDKQLKELYPLPAGNGLFASYARLREIFAEEAKKYKAEVQTDKEVLFGQLYQRYQDLFWNEIDKHDYSSQKKVLDSMMRLLSAANQERALNQAENNDGETTFHLDFQI